MSMKYAPAAGASSLKSQNNATGPRDPGPPAKHTDGHACGMGYKVSSAPGYLNQKAPSNDGPMTLKGY
jgi:hypothetical protein